MHPYRTPPAAPAAEVAPARAIEDDVIAVLLIALGVARVAVAIARGETWTADVTLPALLGAIGIALLASRITRTRVPGGSVTSRSADRARRRGSAAG